MKKFLIILSILATVSACVNNEKAESTVQLDSSTVRDSGTSIMMDTVPHSISGFSFTDIMKDLPENEKALVFDTAYFDDYANTEEETSKSIKRSCQTVGLPDRISCADTVYFCWKMTHEKFTLINLMTVEMYTKGPAVMYHLITVDNTTGKLIDTWEEWAASYSVSIENPNGGGTSAGIEYTVGSIEVNPVLTISSLPRSSDSDVYTYYELSPEGNFVSPYARFEAEKDLQ